jgi:hypothetical protein
MRILSGIQLAPTPHDKRSDHEAMAQQTGSAGGLTSRLLHHLASRSALSGPGLINGGRIELLILLSRNPSRSIVVLGWALPVPLASEFLARAALA